MGQARIIVLDIEREGGAALPESFPFRYSAPDGIAQAASLATCVIEVPPAAVTPDACHPASPGESLEKKQHQPPSVVLFGSCPTLAEQLKGSKSMPDFMYLRMNRKLQLITSNCINEKICQHVEAGFNDLVSDSLRMAKETTSSNDAHGGIVSYGTLDKRQKDTRKRAFFEPSSTKRKGHGTHGKTYVPIVNPYAKKRKSTTQTAHNLKSPPTTSPFRNLKPPPSLPHTNQRSVIHIDVDEPRVSNFTGNNNNNNNSNVNQQEVIELLSSSDESVIYDSDSDDSRAFQELLRGGLTLRKKT